MTPRRGLKECAALQMLAQESAVLKGNAIGAGELQVRHHVLGFGREGRALRKTLLVDRGQTEETLAAAGHDLRRSVVGIEEPRLIVFVKRQQLCHPPRHLGVAGQGRVLAPRQLQPALRLQYQAGQRKRPQAGQYQRIFHGHSLHN